MTNHAKTEPVILKYQQMKDAFASALSEDLPPHIKSKIEELGLSIDQFIYEMFIHLGGDDES